MTRFRWCALLLFAALALPVATPAAYGAVHPRTSLTAVENDLMCVACHEALAVAQAPEAESERRLIARLIAQGDTKAQIDRVMVAQYTQSVLARPPANGFNLSVYILPPAAVTVGLAIIAFALRRSRRSQASAPAFARATPLASADARRLEEDLARYEG